MSSSDLRINIKTTATGDGFDDVYQDAKRLENQIEETDQAIQGLADETDQLADEQKQLNQQFDETQQAANKVEDELEEAANAADELTDETRKLADEQDQLNQQFDETQQAANKVEDELEEAANAADELTDETRKLADEQDQLNQQFDETQQAANKVEDELEEAGQAAEEFQSDLKQLNQETGEYNRSAEELRQEIAKQEKVFESAQSASIQLKVGYKNLAASGDATKEELRELSDQITQAEKRELDAIVATRKLIQEFDNLENESGQSSDEFNELGLRLNDAEGYIDGMTQAVRRADKNMGTLTDSVDNVGDEVKSVGRKVEDFGDKFDKAGQDVSKLRREMPLMSAAGDLLADGIEEVAEIVVEFVQESVQSFQDFDKGFREVMTLLPGESAEFRAELEDDAKALAVELGRLPEEVLPSIYNALSAGVPPDNVIEAVRVSSDAARAGVADLEGTLTLGLGTMNAQVKGVDSLSDVYDQLFFTVKNGVITLPEMNGMMSEVTSIAGEAGVSMQDISAALITMTRQGDSAAEAGELLTITLTQLATAGTTMSDTFEAAAGTSFRNFMAEGHTLGEAMQLLQEHADNTGEALGDILGGGSPFFRDTQAARGALELTGRNLNTLVEFSEKAEEAIGSMSGAAAEMGESASLESEKAAAAWEVMKVSIGEQLKPLTDLFYRAKTAVAEYLTTDLEVRDVASEFADATEGMNLSLTQQYRYLGAVTGGTSFLRDTWDDAETVASRYGIAIDILNQGFDGSRSELEALIEEQLALNDQATVSAEQAEQLTNSFIEQALALDTTKTAIEEQAIAEEEMLFQKQMTTEGVLDATNQVIEATTAERDANDALYQSASEGNAEILADSEQIAAVAEERAAAIAEAAAAEQEAINATREAYNGYALGALESGEATTNWTNELFKSASQQPINQYQLVALAAATGEYTDAQIEAMLREAAMRVAVEELSVALANGQLTVQESINRMKDFEAQLDGDYTAQFDYSDIEAGTTAADGLKASLEAAEGEYHAEFVTKNTTVNTTINQTFDRGTNPNGDPNQAMSAGGVVRGGTPGQDSVHTLLMPGEVVIPNDIVSKYGEDFFMSYVNGAEPNSDLELVPSFPVENQSGDTGDITITIPIQIYGDPDRALIDEFKRETRAIVEDTLQNKSLRANSRIRMRG